MAGGALKPGQPMKVVFANEDTKFGDEWKSPLQALAKQMAADESLRLQLLAYAGGQDVPASKARRLSLSRALAVRSFLIENGVRSIRIDVRALGNKATDEPSNRVDVTIVER